MSIFQEAFDSNGEARETGPIPDGEYSAKLLDIKETPHPVTGTIATSLEFEITEGEHARRRVWDSTKHEDTFMWKVAKVWTSLGLKGMPDDWSDFTRSVDQKCRNMHYEIGVKTRESNGKDYTNITSIKPDSEKPPF
jgi:hypothetical protein|tara:strand:+ start:2331 stop:2741 length:411 start_codon:yes stop_codon:yes gene_type:complete